MKRTGYAAITAISVLALVTVVSAGGCSSDKNGGASSSSGESSLQQASTDPALYGTWKNEDISERMFFTFTFDGDNTGHKISRANKDYEKYYEGTPDISEDDFTYELKDGGLYLHFKDGGYQNFDYIVSGDVLQLSDRYKNDYKDYQKVTEP